MEEMKRISTDAFVSEETGRGRAPRRLFYSHRRVDFVPATRRKSAPVYASSMLIKLGICSAACALVLVLKLIGTPATDQAVASVKQAVTEQEDDVDEVLGKLKFVELPSILSVFAGDDDFVVPAAYTEKNTADEGNLVLLSCKAGDSVSAIGDGVVAAVGTDENYGGFVTITHKNDVQSVCYGLSKISVEVGQPLKKLDTVGVVDENGKLYLSITVGGRPADPGEYLKF